MRRSRSLCLCLTYHGHKRVLSTVTSALEDDSSTNFDNRAERKHCGAEVLPVMTDVQISAALSNASCETFAAYKPGCGLIELSRYGARPFPSKGKFRHLMAYR